MTPPSRLSSTRASTPSFEERGRIGGDTSFMAFDLLMVDGHDVMRNSCGAAYATTSSGRPAASSHLRSQGDSAARTDFAQLTGTFVIKNGVAHNEDLLMSSPVMKMTGHGDIDIAQDKMDYLAKCTVTEAAAKLGGKDLAPLAGILVSVRVTGSLERPEYSVGIDSVAAEIAKGTIQKEIERSIGGGKAGASKEVDALGNVPKGPFGKPK